MVGGEIYREEVSLLEGKEKPQNIGVGLIIFRVDPALNGENASNPKIWTVEELCDKPETGRRKGDISIPLETREPGEPHISLVRRAIFEEFVGKDSPLFATNLFFTLRHKGIILNVDGQNSLKCDLDVVVYDGLRIDIPVPNMSDEVKPHGWMPLFGTNSIMHLPNLRPIARQALNQTVELNLIGKALETYEKMRGSNRGMRPIFPVT